MKKTIIYIGLVLCFAQMGSAENLIENGAFRDERDPLHGWLTDYAWSRNVHYIDNAERVAVVDEHSGRESVASLRATSDAGVKMETQLIPFEPDARYRATLWIKGGNYRVYFSGYQWRPGVRPHAEPTHPEMRPAYRSRAAEGRASSWKKISLEIPGPEPSPMSLQHLRRVRFITLYIWFSQAGYIDDVLIEKIEE